MKTAVARLLLTVRDLSSTGLRAVFLLGCCEEDVMGAENSRIILGDCLEVMRSMEDNSVDLVFCSPPYEAARTYGIGFNLKEQEWVDWAMERYLECVRVSRGLVAWVVEGRTRQFKWSATPALLMADLHRAGVKLRKPPVFQIFPCFVRRQ